MRLSFFSTILQLRIFITVFLMSLLFNCPYSFYSIFEFLFSIAETPTTTTEPSTTRPRTFVPSGKRTTLKPKKSLLDSIQYDEIGAGLLPPGFKPRESTFKPKHSSREGSGRSAGSTFKNSVKDESKGSNAEKETGQGTNRTLESIIGKVSTTPGPEG